MADERKVMAAEVQVEKTRARLLATVEEIGRALEPRKLAREIWEGAKIKGADLAEDAVDAVKARPMATGGALAAVAMFLAREPIKELVGKLVGKGSDDSSGQDAPAPLPADGAARPAPRRRAAPKARGALPPIQETTP